MIFGDLFFLRLIMNDDVELLLDLLFSLSSLNEVAVVVVVVVVVVVALVVKLPFSVSIKF